MSVNQDLATEPPLDGVVPGRVMAIIRSRRSTYVDASLETLINAGLRCLEVTLTTPGAVEVISRWAAAAPSGVHIGCGTVMRAEQVREVVDAGARFIVCPTFSEAVVAECRKLGVPVYPAGWTPTEIVTAWDSGAAAVKLFPAAVGGPDYVRQLRGPLPTVKLVPTGGVDISQVGEYLSAGADAVGLGGPLLGDALEGGDQKALLERAVSALDAVRACPGERA